MSVLDGPFNDNGYTKVAELQQTQTTVLQQERQHGFNATPPKSQSVNAEGRQYPTISQFTDVHFTPSVHHEMSTQSYLKMSITHVLQHFHAMRKGAETGD